MNKMQSGRREERKTIRRTTNEYVDDDLNDDRESCACNMTST